MCVLNKRISRPYGRHEVACLARPHFFFVSICHQAGNCAPNPISSSNMTEKLQCHIQQYWNLEVLLSLEKTLFKAFLQVPLAFFSLSRLEINFSHVKSDRFQIRSPFNISAEFKTSSLILSISEFMCTFPEIWPRTLSPRLRFDRELDFLLPLSGFSIASKSGPDFRSFLPSQSMEIEVRLPTSDTGGR